MKIKVFTSSADKIEKIVNAWLSENDNIKILNRSNTTNWVGPTGSGFDPVMSCMITIIYEYEEIKNES